MIYKLLPGLVSCLYCPFLSLCFIPLSTGLVFKTRPGVFRSSSNTSSAYVECWKEVAGLCWENIWVNISDALLFKKQIVVWGYFQICHCSL